MAKRTVNKTEAVRDYAKAHPKATRGDIAAALTEQGITLKPSHVSNILAKLKKARKTRKAAKAELTVEPTAPAAVEKPVASGGTITLEQIRKVAQAVKTMGGFQDMSEVLDVIKEAGGVKKFKDLAEAMTATEPDVVPF